MHQEKTTQGKGNETGRMLETWQTDEDGVVILRDTKAAHEYGDLIYNDRHRRKMLGVMRQYIYYKWTLSMEKRPLDIGQTVTLAFKQQFLQEAYNRAHMNLAKARS